MKGEKSIVCMNILETLFCEKTSEKLHRKYKILVTFKSKNSNTHHYLILIQIHFLENYIWKEGSYGQGKPGKPEKVREFENFSEVREKSGNFTITQKLEKIFKNQNF